MGSKRAVRSLNQTRNYAGCEKALSLTLHSSEFVITERSEGSAVLPRTARSLASLEMTIYERYRPRWAPNPIFTTCSYSPAKNSRIRSSALSRFSIDVAYEKRTCSVVPKPSPATVATCARCNSPRFFGKAE